MLGLVLNALRARRTQTVAIFALTALAVLGGSAAPWFTSWGYDAVRVADVRSAPTEQRVVRVTGLARYRQGDPSPIGVFQDQVASALAIADGEVTVGGHLFGNVGRTTAQPGGPTAVGLYLGTRTGICEHVRIEGNCPIGPSDVLIGRSTANALGAGVGDEILLRAVRLETSPILRISGVYEVTDVMSPYWTGTDVLSGPDGSSATQVQDAAFVTAPALLRMQPDGIEVDYHLVLHDAAFAGNADALEQALSAATVVLRRQGFDVSSSTGELIGQIHTDQRMVVNGVQIGALELILLSWFALYLAVMQTSDDRRGDIGLMKLRGSSAWRIWMLAAQQSAVPMVAGVIVGVGLGYVSAAVLAGNQPLPPAAGSAAWSSTLAMSVLVAAGIGVGALLVSIAAEWRALRSPVTTLMRRVPGRRRAWRNNVSDVAVAALAAVGVYQGYAEGGSGPSILSLLTPGLVGLATALLMGRLLPRLGDRVGVGALRAGRPGMALSALNLARRPGTARVFTVLAVAVAMVATTVFTWHSAHAAWAERAALELGAPRTLVVTAANSRQLLAAVRAADPDGRYAMAVAISTGSRAENQTLAVDSSRLRAVAILPDAYGIADGVTAALHPAMASLPRIQDGQVTMDVTDATAAIMAPAEAQTQAPAQTPAQAPAAVLPLAYADPATPVAPISVRIHLELADGTWRSADVGPIAEGRRGYDAVVSGCGAAGCRLVGFELVTSRTAASVQLHALRQNGADLVSGKEFGDITRWRGPLGPASVGPVVSARDDHLVISGYSGRVPNGRQLDQRVFVVDAPGPIPAVLAGDRPAQVRAGDGRLTALGVLPVPYTDVATVALLPRLGSHGALMDLEYAGRLTGRPDEAVALEVWLAADAPPQLVDMIRAAGVQVLTDRAVNDVTDRFGAGGPGLALRYQLFAALILLLLSAGEVVVFATVRRRERAQELGHLRTQGLPHRSMRFAGYAAIMLVGAAAISTGLLAAVGSQSLVAVSLPVFTDNFALLPRPAGVGAASVGLAVAAAVVALVPVALVASARDAAPTGSGPWEYP